MTTDDQKRQREFLALVEPLYERLERFCRVMTRNNEEARDVLSETLLQAYRSFSSVRNHKAFLSFLFSIASRVHKRQFRQSKFQGAYDEHSAMQMHDTRHSPEVAADVALLHDAIRQLPDKQREAVILFELLDLPLEEVRRVQGCSLSAVKVRLLRARQKLTAILRPHFDARSVSAEKTPTPTAQSVSTTRFFSSNVAETL